MFDTASAKRVQRWQAMPDDVRQSAWINKYRKSPWKWRLIDLVVFHYPSILLIALHVSMRYRLTLILIAVSWYYSPFKDELGTRVFLGFLQVAFIGEVLGYAHFILTRTPWKDRSYPLVQSSASALLGTPVVAKMLLVAGLVSTYFTVSPFLGSYPFTQAVEMALQPPVAWFAPLLLAQSAFLGWLMLWQPAFICGRLLSDEDAQSNRVAARSDKSGEPAAAEDEADTPFKAKKARFSFLNVVGMLALKEDLIERGRMIVSGKSEFDEQPRNGILLHGDPGNGKTFFAEALAGELNVPFIEVTVGPQSSEWLGKQPRTLANTFSYAKRVAPCVLFIDEIDSFIRARDGASTSTEDIKITNTILTEIVGLRGTGVVLIGATNYLSKLDAAAIREGRFDFKVEVPPPDSPARVGLIERGVKKYAVNLTVDMEQARAVAMRWSGFSVARLTAVCKALPDVMKDQAGVTVTHEHWMQALRRVQGRNGQVPVDAKSLSEMVMAEESRQTLHLIASRLSDVARIEGLGGMLPTGVLFFGPSGTGKTAAAKALAKASGWAFLSMAGPDLLSDKDTVSRLYSEAKDLRPCLIFIDEADDVLQDRRYGQHTWIVNKLLTLMDGTGERVRDVVWVAATNHPDQIDPALLRPGRFTEKVMFAAPEPEQLISYVQAWLSTRSHVRLAHDLDTTVLAHWLAGATIAETDGILQYALNLSISEVRGNAPIELTANHIRVAVETVKPQQPQQ